MNIIGIICEYNPFHNGHIYHIRQIKKLYPDSLIILILNGYFLERGEISILTKESKTKIVLEHEVDIVLELPVLFGTQSADTFAEIAIKMLNHFKVNKLIFGSECDDINMLTNLAQKQLNPEFNEQIKDYLKKGINYPTALAKATNTDFTFNPNDLLGISYIKAILKNNFAISPITIKRTNSYHDTIKKDKIISASNIRAKLAQNKNIKKYLPKLSYQNIQLINNETLFKLLKYKILTCENLDSYLDVTEGIHYRLQKHMKTAQNFPEFIDSIKTKRYTFNKLNRMLIHILLGIKKNKPEDIEYIKILGFNKRGQEYIKTIKKDISIPTSPVVTSKTYIYELNASLIYDLICNTDTYTFELKNKPIIKN